MGLVMPKHELIEYTAVPTIARFHQSNAWVRGIRGPYASGKSTACCMELMRRAREQRPNGKKIRQSRWVIVRNTYRELKDTTMKTWFDWFPEETFGDLAHGDMAHRVEFDEADGTTVQAEFLFRALDRPDDVGKLLSLEITGAWVNEARELPKGVIDALIDRMDRFPSKRAGGASWAGLIMDTNPPDDDHWWYELAEDTDTPGWEFYTQPPAVFEAGPDRYMTNPKADNLENLNDIRYYDRICVGKSRDYILVHYGNQYGFVQEGKPVYPEYVDTVHFNENLTGPMRNRTVYIGIDFGLTPAATFGQVDPSGRWLTFDELVTEDMGAVRFSELLGPKIRHELRDYDIEIYGDPSGDERAPTDEKTPFMILQAHGIPVLPAPSNDPIIRREAVGTTMTRMFDGKPGFEIGPKCKILRKGLAGGYAFKRIQVMNENRFRNKPDKNRFSHVCEGQQYMMLGAGEGDTVIPMPTSWGEPLTYVRPPMV
jgi:hypothetical protein